MQIRFSDQTPGNQGDREAGKGLEERIKRETERRFPDPQGDSRHIPSYSLASDDARWGHACLRTARAFDETRCPCDRMTAKFTEKARLSLPGRKAMPSSSTDTSIHRQTHARHAHLHPLTQQQQQLLWRTWTEILAHENGHLALHVMHSLSLSLRL